jgi:hypothetical protein
MKELTEEIILRASKSSPQDALIFILRKYGIGCCSSSYIISSAEYIDLSWNDLQTVSQLFEQFPRGWWFNLSHNNVCYHHIFLSPTSSLTLF